MSSPSEWRGTFHKIPGFSRYDVNEYCEVRSWITCRRWREAPRLMEGSVEWDRKRYMMIGDDGNMHCVYGVSIMRMVFFSDIGEGHYVALKDPTRPAELDNLVVLYGGRMQIKVGRVMPIRKVNAVTGEVLEVYQNAAVAARMNGVSRHSIARRAKGISDYSKELVRYEYANEEDKMTTGRKRLEWLVWGIRINVDVLMDICCCSKQSVYNLLNEHGKSPQRVLELYGICGENDLRERLRSNARRREAEHDKKLTEGDKLRALGYTPFGGEAW